MDSLTATGLRRTGANSAAKAPAFGKALTLTRSAGGATTHQPTRAVLYMRVSSKDQEAEGFSIPAQVRLLREYAASQGFVIEAEFVDVETAKASGRTHFSEMLAFVKSIMHRAEQSW